MIWIRSQDGLALIKCINIQYVARERFTEDFIKLERDVKRNPQKYMNPKTNKRLFNSSREIGEFLEERMEKYIEHRLVNYSGTYDSGTLAIYPTKERCLEVLDEIEKAIEESNIMRYEYFQGFSQQLIEYTYKGRQIYQMPKE